MLHFNERTGPVFDPPVDYPEVPVPQWWRDAKFGIFIHWGLYSLPAWAEVHGVEYPAPDPSERDWEADDPYAHHHYAEWIGNTVRFRNSHAERYFVEKYGEGCSYEDLAHLWHAERFNAAEVVAFCREIGAGYLVPTTKHHDGFCLWDTETTSFNAAQRGPGRDLIAEFADACADQGMPLGLYYSGALDWHVSDFPRIDNVDELFGYRRNDPEFAAYCAKQLRELIARFSPRIIWNDIEWPDGGKGHDDNSLAVLIREYLKAVPDGTINDRFGTPMHGFLTREYSRDEGKLPVPWEATRGLAASFGFNQNEGSEQIMSGPALTRFFAQTFARGGNVLLNIGLRADGTIPERYIEPLRELGAWLNTNHDVLWNGVPDQDAPQPTQDYGIIVDPAERQRYLLVHTDSSELELPLPEAARLVDTAGKTWEYPDQKLTVPAEARGAIASILRVLED